MMTAQLTLVTVIVAGVMSPDEPLPVLNVHVDRIAARYLNLEECEVYAKVWNEDYPDQWMDGWERAQNPGIEGPPRFARCERVVPIPQRKPQG